MVDIPAEIRITASLQSGSVYYFEEERLTSTEPHYFVVLNKNPHKEEFLVLVVASSQVEKRKRIARNLGFPEETLVVITPQEYSTFRVETVIDCNSVFEKSIQSLVDKLNSNQLKICTDPIPDDIVQKLIAGVLTSTQVTMEVQALLAKNTVSET